MIFPVIIKFKLNDISSHFLSSVNVNQNPSIKIELTEEQENTVKGLVFYPADKVLVT